MLALIALRNLSRNRRRTLLSLLVVSVGYVGVLLTAGFVRYSFDGLGDAIIFGGIGHLEVGPDAEAGVTGSPADRLGRPPGFRGWRIVRDQVERHPHVRAAGAAIQFAGVATNGDSTASFLGMGVEPDRETRMGMKVRLRAGTNLAAEAAENDDQVLLGIGLARSLGAGPGDTVVVMVADPEGSLNAVDMTVVGLFTTGLQELDSRVLKTHVSTAQRLLSTDNVTSLIVCLDDADATMSTETDLRATLTGQEPLSVVNWQARAPFYGSVRALYGGIFAFLGAIVAMLVALSTSNTMLMSVLERVREFGALLAMGTTRSQLARLLVLEALWLALFGGVAGSGLGLVLVVVINALGIDMPPPPGAADPIQLALAVAPTDLLWIFVGMAVVLVVASVPPMVRVFRLQIVDALGHV